MVKVRIQHDGGKPWNTKITDVQTGEPLDLSVFKIDLTLDVQHMPIAVLHTWMPVVDVIVDAEISTHCPLCRQEVLIGTKHEEESC